MDCSRAACAFVFIAHAPNGRAIRVAYLVAARRTDAHGSEAFGILDRATIDHSPPLAYVSNFYQVRSSPVRAPAVVPYVPRARDFAAGAMLPLLAACVFAIGNSRCFCFF